MAEIARMRTIKKALTALKDEDKETCITENFIRGAVRENKIRSIKAGNRFLIDQSDLENLIESMAKTSITPSITPSITGIRRVEVRR